MNTYKAAALAAALISCAPVAAADPFKANHWVGVDGTTDGFLVDTATGDVWMTGVCLKYVGQATASGSEWHVRRTEMVSVGRARTALDQTFLLDLAPNSPSITVINPDRGGQQTIEDVSTETCGFGSSCDRFVDAPTC